jgi:hypothetical protein
VGLGCLLHHLPRDLGDPADQSLLLHLVV